MADNVAITAGSGTSIATDDEAGVHYQKVKLVASADGSTAPLSRAEDAAHTDGDHGILMLGVRNHSGSGSDGDYSALCVSSTGELCTIARRDLTRISVQSAGLTTAATAYTAGDQLGNQFTITDAARSSGGSGVITGVQLVSAADTIGSIDVVFFDSSVTLAANDAAFAISDADALKIVGLVPLAGAYDIGNNRICQAFNLAIPYVCSGSANLYAGLITRYAIPATPFAAATDIQLIVYVERN